MRLLVAAHADGPGEFTWTIPGELVLLATVCDRDRPANGGDRGCGCSRAFVGFTSGKATTTAHIAEVDIDRVQLAQLVRDHLARSGWDPGPPDVADITDELIALGERWPTGTTVSRVGDAIEAR